VFKAEVPKEALRGWAAARGLAYEEEGLLPPISSVLREGLGAGSHLAGLITRESDHGYTAEGGFTRRQERHTFNLCRGALPGGVEGVLAHHQHLESRSTSDGSTWVAAVDTVVVARLPERSRALCELRVTPGARAELKALFSFDASDGDTPLALPATGVQEATRGPHTFRINPPEDDATLDAVAGPDMLTALAHAPADTQVEYVDGVLCVWARGIVEDHAALDALCAVALCVQRGIRAAVARHGELDPAVALPPPAGVRQRWLDEHVARVPWERPPASVADARAAYTPLVSARAGRSGSRARTWVLLLGLLGSVLWVLGAIFFARLLDDPIALIAAPFGFLYGVYKTVRIAFESADEVAHDEVMAQVGPWSLEAFARGYARARGLTIEDPDALRHRFTSPVGGRPLRAMQGDLGGGVQGHVALWRDWVANAHWLVAVVGAPPGEPRATPPYQAARSGRLLVVGRQVGDEQRSAAALDALLAEARRLGSRADADGAGAQPVAAGEAGPAGPPAGAA
jgi:hypothetical protein